MTSDLQKADIRKKNIRLGVTLGSIAIVFFIGFMVKLVFFGR